MVSLSQGYLAIPKFVAYHSNLRSFLPFEDRSQALQAHQNLTHINTIVSLRGLTANIDKVIVFTHTNQAYD